jgi:hypothetical protein
MHSVDMQVHLENQPGVRPAVAAPSVFVITPTYKRLPVCQFSPQPCSTCLWTTSRAGEPVRVVAEPAQKRRWR